MAFELPQGDAPSQIALLQQRREDLHAQWVKKRYLGEADLQEYCQMVSKISRHRHDSNFVNLVDHVRAHRITMAVLGRLVDYVGLFERDLYFVTLALLYRQGLRPDLFFTARGMNLLLNGQIIFALRECRNNSPEVNEILNELAKHFTEVWARGNVIADVRNNLAHLSMVRGSSPAPRLTYWINQTRRLMAYDRKLKNAVSKSVIELMSREGIQLRWEMKVEGRSHDLATAELASRCATHLGGKRLTLLDAGPRPRWVLLDERLHSDGYVAMIAAAFEGKMRRQTSITEDLSRIDWKSSSEKKRSRREPFNPGSNRPPSDRRTSGYESRN